MDEVRKEKLQPQVLSLVFLLEQYLTAENKLLVAIITTASEKKGTGILVGSAIANKDTFVKRLERALLEGGLID